MALANIPRWLEPPDFMSAIHQGSAIGLQRANLQSEADQAANRLGLGYAELAQRARQAQAEQEFAREKSAAEALLHATAEQHLMDYRNKEIEQRQAEEARKVEADKIRVGEALSKHDYFAGKLTVAQTAEKRKAAEDLVKASSGLNIAPGHKLLARDEKGNLKLDSNGNPVVVFSNPSAASLNDPTQYETIKTTIPKVEETPASSGFLGLGWGGHPAVPGKPEEVHTRKVRISQPASAALTSPAIATDQSWNTGQTAPWATATPSHLPSVTTQEDFDALPPGAVYISDDGKPHRKPGP